MSLPKNYTEEEAAALLFKGSPIKTAKRKIAQLRNSGKIRCYKAGNLVGYTEAHLIEFMEGKLCQENTQSETSGSAKEKAEKSGTSHGTTPKQDKHVISLVAQKTFGKPKR
jgi:hypothetical protein